MSIGFSLAVGLNLNTIGINPSFTKSRAAVLARCAESSCNTLVSGVTTIST
nr:hypothetical protein [Acinetobacter sp.]